MCTSVEQKNAIILQVEASWQYICACIHTAEHHVIATEFYRRCFFFFALVFVATSQVSFWLQLALFSHSAMASLQLETWPSLGVQSPNVLSLSPKPCRGPLKAAHKFW